MNYRHLGKSNLKVSALCVGSMMFGDQTDLAEAGNILASAREHGVNFIDTADVYSRGGSERMLGTLLQGGRDDWVLATKLGYPMAAQPNQSQYSRKWILQAPALGLVISAEEEALVDALVAAWHASRPGYSDPLHPFFGRMLARAT